MCSFRPSFSNDVGFLPHKKHPLFIAMSVYIVHSVLFLLYFRPLVRLLK